MNLKRTQNTQHAQFPLRSRKKLTNYCSQRMIRELFAEMVQCMFAVLFTHTRIWFPNICKQFGWHVCTSLNSLTLLPVSNLWLYYVRVLIFELLENCANYYVFFVLGECHRLFSVESFRCTLWLSRYVIFLISRKVELCTGSHVSRIWMWHHVKTRFMKE